MTKNQAIEITLDFYAGGEEIHRVLIADTELTPNAVRMLRGAIAEVTGRELTHGAIDSWERRLWAQETGRGGPGGETLIVCCACHDAVIPFSTQVEANDWARAHRAGTMHRVVTIPGWPTEEQAARIAHAHLAELGAPGEAS
jgi:hypothetical protein